MFGDNSNDTNQQPAGDNTPPPMLDTPMASDPPADSSSSMPMSDPADPPADNQPMDSTPSSTQADWMASPSEPTETPEAPAAEEEHHDDLPEPEMPSGDMSAPAEDSAPATTASSDDLLNIKQQALQQLTPLVDHLDQSPKEEFRTTMMMIQATDNQDLVKKAFDAAQKIEDDKERAQAFLDIINEINYFTQHHEQ